MSRYIEKAPTDPAGLKAGVELPYHFQPRDVLRIVEDMHDVLHEINSMMDAKSFNRMEELLDPAGFSGFVSRTIVEGLDRHCRALVRNEFHNGYPDLLPHGVYPSDAVQHGERGGLEVKASRNPSSWESHGPRGGWFCVVQFALDENKDKALKDREPTKVLAVMIEQLEKEDWNWQPAKEGKIRSGTASIRPSGAAKLRTNAAWVEPSYQHEHDERLTIARLATWRSRAAEDDCLEILIETGEEMKPAEIAEIVATKILVPAERVRSATESALKKLVKAETISKPKPGRYMA